MFYKHQVIDDNLYLYIDFNYEFGIDFHLKGKKGKARTLYENAIKYIKDKKIDFKHGKVLLVVGGIVIGTLLIQGYNQSLSDSHLNPPFKYVEHIDIFGNEKPKEDIFAPPVENNEATTNQTTLIEPPSVSAQTSSTTITTPEPPPTPPPAVTTPPSPSTTTPSTVEKGGPLVTLSRYNGTIEELALEDYVVGVVAGEMPASFNIEALKSQSVLARTYALKKIAQNQILKDDTSNQVYKDINQLKSLWGSDFNTYFNKIKNTVSATKGEYLTYNGSYIEAVYHSTSNGKTEDSIAVWDNSFPYLKSVDSHWDLNASSYLRETAKEFNVLSSIIGINFNELTNIEVLSKTNGGRINEIKIDNTIFNGVELRNLLGLRSADFDIKIEDGKAIFTTRGYGHGVGMSQYGANGMAKEGYSYKDILNHYYPGTKINN